MDELRAGVDAFHAARAVRHVVIVALAVVLLPHRLRPRYFVCLETIMFVDGEVAAERIGRSLGEGPMVL
jgi:hypothetical protein